MLMKTKYDFSKINLSFIDTNYILEFLGHSPRKNKKEATFLLEKTLVGMTDKNCELLIEFIVIKSMYDYKYIEIIPFLSRVEKIDVIKKLFLDQAILREELDISNELTNIETLHSFETLLEDFEDEYLEELLIDAEVEDGIDYDAPDTALKRYLLNLLGIHPSKLSKNGDEILLSTNYNPELLNLKDKAPQEFIETLKKVHSYLDQPGPKEFYSYAVIFEGESGTGKTEFAKYIANSLGRYFIHLSYGSLSSGFAGDTESNIKKMFEDAKNKKALIFLDEADSFLFNRNSAIQDFQVSIVNEMLQQIEKYPGIVICSTNLLGKIDKAALRRFPEKIQFDYLKNNQAQIAFEKYFKKPINSKEMVLLDKIKDLSLGDFKAVRQKTFLDEKIDNLKLINLLKLEVDFRARIEL